MKRQASLSTTGAASCVSAKVLPAFEAAGVGVVMANGTDEAKSHADYITTRTNNESGVSEIIHRFIM